MVCMLALGIGDGATQRVGTEHYVGVGEEKPITAGDGGGLPHGMGLSQPAGWKLANVEHAEASGRGGGDAINNFAGGIGGAIVDDNDLEVVVVLAEQ